MMPSPSSLSWLKAKTDLKHYMTNPNTPAEAVHYDDPFDDPNFDYEGYIAKALEAVDFPVCLRRTELSRWAAAAGFEAVNVRHLGEPDSWEMRFQRGTNVECTNLAQIERWLGFVARGSGCRFVPGQFIALVVGDSIAARFRLEPREKP